VSSFEGVDEAEEVAVLEGVDEAEEVATLEEIDEAEEVAILEEIDEAEEVAILEEIDEAEEVEEYEKVAVLEETEHVYPEETSEAKSIFDEIMSHLLVEAEEETYEEEIETLASDIFVSETSKENEDVVGIFDKGREETEIKGVEKEISSLDKLEKNKYYIQIATVKQESSLDSILKNFASKYPLEILGASGLYQILVGPFTDDEYKVVLERFKQREFKDAFVRHVK
jgi:phosphoglycolate phosphatase-like HAD superfamily hydrolase